MVRVLTPDIFEDLVRVSNKGACINAEFEMQYYP